MNAKRDSNSLMAEVQRTCFREKWSPRRLKYTTIRTKFLCTVETLDLLGDKLHPYLIIDDWRFEYWPWWSGNETAFQKGCLMLDQIIELAERVHEEAKVHKDRGYDYDMLLASDCLPVANFYQKELKRLWKTRDKNCDPPSEPQSPPPIEWQDWRKP